MKLNRKTLAPFGLYLAILAALASIALYIVRQQFDIWLEISLGLIVIGISLYAILDPKHVREVFTGRQAKYGSNTLVMSLAFVGIIIVINFVGDTYTKRWDLTQSQSNSLSSETLDALKKLPSKVTARAYYTSKTSSTSAQALLTNYKINSNGKFDFTIIDPDSDPVDSTADNVTVDGTIVLKMGSSSMKADSVDEQGITTALVRLISPEQRTLYFITGHGEPDPEGSSTSSYSDVASALTNKGYTVKTLNLISSPTIPSDAKALIINGPQKPLSSDEVKLIQDYVSKGGSLVVMEDPTITTEFGSSADPMRDYLTNTWGITLGADIVIDESSNSTFLAVAAKYGTHAITDKLNSMVTVFPYARSVVSKTIDSVTATTLVYTGQNSWAETDLDKLKSSNQASPDQGTDIISNVPLAVAATNSTTSSRVVVIGNSTFAIDSNYSAYGNGSFIINSIDWAAKEDTLINLTTKSSTTQVVVAPLKSSVNLIFLGLVIGFPGLVLFAGILTWFERRHRG